MILKRRIHAVIHKTKIYFLDEAGAKVPVNERRSGMPPTGKLDTGPKQDCDWRALRLRHRRWKTASADGAIHPAKRNRSRMKLRASPATALDGNQPKAGSGI